MPSERQQGAYRYFACFCTQDKVNETLDYYVEFGWQLKTIATISRDHGSLSTYCLVLERPNNETV